ncbi:tetratricopeptide repeat protein [Albibacterium indicum]|uniref:tetratricopeptide repeat protein n=1 Tax=Albibacterium indicum TaxID=2292082 RepID=UPI001300BA61|nr:tetratricopeptide repeat protein [Pedobacter indicus]
MLQKREMKMNRIHQQKIKEKAYCKMKKAFLLFFVTFMMGQPIVWAQSDEKEGNNAFAMYAKTADFKQLENARKFSDNAYKERRDSSAYKNNLLRALVYSSLAVADSNRSLKYSKDPIDEAKFALSKLNDEQLNYENEAQITYIHRKLGNAHLILGRRALNNNKYEEAYNHLKQVDTLSRGDIQVNRNLAVLASQLEKNDEAIHYYNAYLESKDNASAEDILIMADLYNKTGNQNERLNVLLSGSDSYPDNKDILFQIINIYAGNGSYDAVVPLIEHAIRLEPENVELNYLAGYAYEVTGNRKQAEQYYKTTLDLDDNNYNANFELGLLYLRDFVSDTANMEKKDLAEKHLLKANEIDPNSVNALQSLAVLFDKSGDTIQYERVSNQLNQNTFN